MTDDNFHQDLDGPLHSGMNWFFREMLHPESRGYMTHGPFPTEDECLVSMYRRSKELKG